MSGVDLDVMPDILAVSRLAADAPIPAWAARPSGALHSVTRTGAELSVICAQHLVPPGVTAQRGMRALRVRGPLDFALTGILASLAAPLAEAGVSIFALCTYDTDYVLVPEARLGQAIAALAAAGHRVNA